MSALVKSVRLRLNPFEIRGGLKPHYRLLGEYARHRLNPFEIRGGLKLGKSRLGRAGPES